MTEITFGQHRVWIPTALRFFVNERSSDDSGFFAVVDELGGKRRAHSDVINLLSHPLEEVPPIRPGSSIDYHHDAAQFSIPDDNRQWFANGLALIPGEVIFFHRDVPGADKFHVQEITDGCMKIIPFDPGIMFPK